MISRFPPPHLAKHTPKIIILPNSTGPSGQVADSSFGQLSRIACWESMFGWTGRIIGFGDFNVQG